ncbi:DUF885 domain-containing protein [Sphingomonas sp. KR1UV-12]|uniref:DUF885 domain-containing protein n=1 Tax=Sphingomonas aurea TaxID=3063994 RepID=A0ABT9EGH9_9SPHN|nr:DUF885 domain-containing protein [Sphingomonas sp. KR1UV-12]MDP1026069.1 DUF885 domain-containing protein [Sphingomonas sp. KR1UV-12]
MRKLVCAALLLATGTADAQQAAPATPSASAAKTRWAQFRDAYIEQLFRLDPGFAVYQGRHDFDGQVQDWSPAGLKRLGDFYRRSIADARRTPATTADERFERDYLVKVTEGRLFWLEDADQPHANPQWYVSNGLDPNVYVARDYAPVADRARALTRFLRAVPAAAANIRANLKTPMPLSFAQFGAAAFNGFADYYEGDAVHAFATVRDDRIQRDLKAAAASAAAAMRSLGGSLDAARRSANAAFPLGAARFQRMLAATEGVTTPLAALEAAGRADLARNRAALVAACAQFAPGATVPACVDRMNADKPANGPVAEARRQIPVLRQFVLDKDLVTIPGTEKALVEEAPPYMRQNAAYIDPPGPFEHGIPSIYYIAPPDPAWDKATRDAFVVGVDNLLFTSVHEVMPGHFLQFLHANRSPSLFGRIFVGYAFAEGWAHYSEEMMWEAGLGAGDPKVHIGQLSNALLRDCRFLSAIGLHARGWTQEQSRQMFVEQCFQDEGTARQQSARGTYDPAYLNYTMGKLMIRRLRADWTATRGGRAGWKAFHDAFLGYGGPPIPLVRQRMMGEATARAMF